VLGDGEVVGSGWSLGEDAHLVDEVGYELAAPDFEYLHGLSRGLERGAIPHRVTRRPVAIYQSPAFRLGTNVSTILAQLMAEKEGD
jgi:hypothetical protein